jgi:hypothetical protein
VAEDAAPPGTQRSPAPAEEAARTRKVAPEEHTPAPLEDAKDASETLLNWRDLASPELRQSKVLAKYKTAGEALDALVHQSELLGRSIQIPKDNASDTQKRLVYEKLGCPKTASEYTITDPDMGTDEEGNAKTLAPDFVGSLLQLGHDMMLAPWQLQKLVDFTGQTVVRSEKIQAGEMAMQKAEAQRELFHAFGAETPTLIEKAKLFFTNAGTGRYGGGKYAEEAAEAWVNSPLANHPAMIAALANMWDNYKEGVYIESGAGGSLETTEQAQADIHALNAIAFDESKPMPERQAAQERVLQLRRMLNEQQAAVDARNARMRH